MNLLTPRLTVRSIAIALSFLCGQVARASPRRGRAVADDDVDGLHRGGIAVCDGELGDEIVDVLGGGDGADAEEDGDLGVALAVDEQAEDFGRDSMASRIARKNVDGCNFRNLYHYLGRQRLKVRYRCVPCTEQPVMFFIPSVFYVLLSHFNLVDWIALMHVR